MRLQRDLRAFIESLNSESVEYAIVGGWALGFHGRPRYTQDIDILVRATPENAARVVIAIEKFGFGSLGLSAHNFLVSGQVIQLGQPPNRIDLLTSLTGLTAEEIWDSIEPGELDGVPVFFLGRSALIKNKKATGRPRDRADVEELGGQ
ncbi:MAG: hypothetical protein ABSF22_04885 [Bryobacteraceae bacterium]